MDSAKPTTIVFIGRTGAGKTSTINKIVGSDVLKVGHTLDSETEEIATITTNWPVHPSTMVQLIDAAGFGDNRLEMTNAVLFQKVISFLNSLQDGLHIALFCISAKRRIDAHDIEELEMLGLLLGSALFKHVYIVVTQGNTLREDDRNAVHQNFLTGLPGILEKHGISSFPKEKILFADFDTFESSFLVPLGDILQNATSYKPTLAAGIDPNNPDSVQMFLASEELKPVMAKYEAMIEEQKKKAEQFQALLEQQARENERLAEQRQRDKSEYERSIATIQEALAGQQSHNEALIKQHEQQLEKQRLKLQVVKTDLDGYKQRTTQYEAQLEAKRQQIEAINNRITELQKAREQQPSPSKEGGSCNIF